MWSFLALLALGTAAALVLNAFEDNLVFFYSPIRLVEKRCRGPAIRVGGLVEEGSVEKDGLDVASASPTAPHRGVASIGVLPDLFREGQGIVYLGRLAADGTFQAEEVLAKHDENYMPPEVADALKAGRRVEAGATNTDKATMRP